MLFFSCISNHLLFFLFGSTYRWFCINLLVITMKKEHTRFSRWSSRLRHIQYKSRNRTISLCCLLVENKLYIRNALLKHRRHIDLTVNWERKRNSCRMIFLFVNQICTWEKRHGLDVVDFQNKDMSNKKKHAHL
jgi:hypothetical protein